MQTHTCMVLFTILNLSKLLVTATAYSWEFSSTPTQCGELNLKLIGSGRPPYRALFIPIGPNPLLGSPEIRWVLNVPFNDSSSLKIPNFPYPSKSQFVIVVSDSIGFGTGGVSAAITLEDSSNDACFDKKHPSLASFPVTVDPSPSQCGDSRLWWDPSLVKGIPYYQGIIPGGDAFNIVPGEDGAGNITRMNDQGLGTGFTWPVALQAQSQVILTAADNRGYVAGSAVFTVEYGETASCLNGSHPSSTAGSPAGASFPTSSDSTSASLPTISDKQTMGMSLRKQPNVGAITGGAISGITALLALIIFARFIARRRRCPRQEKERPYNLLGNGNDFQPHTFPVARGTIAAGRLWRKNRVPAAAIVAPPVMPVAARLSAESRSLIPQVTSHHRDSNHSVVDSAAGPNRPVNIIMHDDGGRAPDPTMHIEPGEILELPPTYTSIRPRSTRDCISTRRHSDFTNNTREMRLSAMTPTDVLSPPH